MGADEVFLLTGLSLLLAVFLPYALKTAALSPPVVLLGLGALIGLLPVPAAVQWSPTADRAFIEHLTEFTVIIALMGVGLALDRPLSLRSLRSWGTWGTTWRLLAIAMPLSIAGVALLGWGLGLAPASAVLLGAVLAPTDPVLASDVQVEGPTTEQDDDDTIDEDDEVRFALTSEAGLNDGLAFPFVALAILMAGSQSVGSWWLTWLAWDLVGKVIVGAVVGVLTGWLLAKGAFRSRRPSVRVAETGEPLLAIAAVLVSYGAAEVVGGYGFLSVFACAMTIRSAERNSSYHALMHQVIERLERLLTLIVLLMVGIAMTGGILESLTWRGVAVGVLLLFVIRPLSAWVGMRFLHPRVLGPRERWATAFFGVRGVGSLFYLAYALGHGEFTGSGELWSTVTFTVTLSVLLHGVSATPIMRRLDEHRSPDGPDDGQPTP